MTISLVIDDLPINTDRVIFDVSRLLRMRDRAFGTGVDRIDLAVARHLLDRLGEGCAFVHDGPLGPTALPHALGAAFIAALAARWSGLRPDADLPGLRAALLCGSAAACFGRAFEAAGATYVNASHSGLPAKAGALRRLDPAGAMRRLVYLHDLIPLDYPEYQRPQSVLRFRGFLDAVADRPLTVAANSVDTARRVEAFAARHGWTLERAVVALPRAVAGGGPGTDAGAMRPQVARALRDPRPLFVTLGTIEPRKNHLLLLHLWRRLAEEHPGPPHAAIPRLAIIGRRGWENEMVLDMLDRCPATAAHVAEFGDLSDVETLALMGHARALLFPSFAEGLGVPLLEAAVIGLPAIVSDLPALREIAAPGTVFLDPLDGPAWRRAILAAAG